MRATTRYRSLGRAALPAVVLAALAAFAPAATAQTGTGSAQLLYGSGFQDQSVGNATDDGAMGTLTIEHFGPWALGDHFFFLDVTSGTFDAGLGRSYRMYGEWTPRLSLSRATGRRLAAGPVADVLLEAEVQAGSGGYAAALVGPSVNLDVPGFAMLTASALYRNDAFDDGTWQVTTAWALPLELGVDLTLAGFADVIGTPGGGARLFTQPQLLVEIGSLAGTDRRDVQVGLEWYIHRTAGEWHTVPQAMVRWAW